MDKPRGGTKLGPVGKTHSPLHNLLQRARRTISKEAPTLGPTDPGRRNCRDPEPRPSLTVVPKA